MIRFSGIRPLMPSPRPTLVLFLALLGTGSALGLEWQTTTVEARAEPFQKALTLSFVFRNTGAKPVAILDLQTDCSCITASADKKNYAPGETGRVTAQFSLDDRSGPYDRHLSVLTDEPVPPQRLNVRIEVPELASLTPRSLEWRIGETLAEKIIEIRTMESLRLIFTEATPTNDTFTARLETVTPDQVYRLTVAPRNTTAVANAAIRISGRDSTGHAVLVSAYANVR